MGNGSNAASPNNDPSSQDTHNVRGAAASMKTMMDSGDESNRNAPQIQNYQQYPPSTQQYQQHFITASTPNNPYGHYPRYPPQGQQPAYQQPILHQINNQTNQPQINASNSLSTPPQASTASTMSGSTVSVSSQGQIQQVPGQISINQNQLGQANAASTVNTGANALLLQNPNPNPTQIGQLQLQLQQQIQELQILQQKQQIERQRIALLKQQNELDQQRITHEAQQQELMRRHAEQQQVLQLQLQAQHQQAQEQIRVQQLQQLQQQQQAQAQAQAAAAKQQAEQLRQQQLQQQAQAKAKAAAQAQAQAQAQQQQQQQQQQASNIQQQSSASTTNGHSQDEKYPVIFRWNHGGRDVYVAYSGDNWSQKYRMHRSHNDFSLIMEINPGVYHYKFIVDNQWRCAPDQKHVRDANGAYSNVLDVRSHSFEQVMLEQKKKRKREKIKAQYKYTQNLPKSDHYVQDPPICPIHLHKVILNNNDDENGDDRNDKKTKNNIMNNKNVNTMELPKPLRVSLNHLYVSDKREEEVVTLGMTERYKDKFFTTVYYTPIESRGTMESSFQVSNNYY